MRKKLRVPTDLYYQLPPNEKISETAMTSSIISAASAGTTASSLTSSKIATTVQQHQQQQQPQQQQPQQPVLYSSLGPLSSWSFGEPMTARQGGRVVSIYTSPGEKSAPLVQLAGDGEPCLLAPYGVHPPAEGAASDRFNLELAVTHEPLKNFLAELDTFFRRIATDKCSTWFRKTLRPEEICLLQRPLVTKPTTRVPHELLRVKVPPTVRVWRVRPNNSPGSGGGGGGCWVYSTGSLEDVTSGCSCWVTVSISSLYFLPRLFGCTLTARDLLVFPQRNEAPAFPFLTTVSIMEEEEETETHATSAVIASAQEA